MRLAPAGSEDPRVILRALTGALHGAGPALALGATPDASDEVPAGTAVVVTTSGSTGVPKSVILSRSALTASALATAERIGSGAWLLALPATYVAGLQVLVRAIIAGREPALLSGRFSAQAFASAALMMASARGGRREPTYTSLVPAQLTTMLDAAEEDETARRALRSFEAILIGGQALPVALRERAQAIGARIVRTYGSTETSGGCVYDGIPLPGTALRIVGGEVQLSGPTLADGYLGDPGRTAEVFPRDADGTRWYRTGDDGVIEDGVLRVRGRIDNVIVSGGINVSLDRVEQTVRGVAGLEGAVVVGVPDERWGEASVIVLARTTGEDAGPREDPRLLEDARAAVAAEIGPHARPSRLALLDELPVLPSGKPDRRAILRAVF